MPLISVVLPTYNSERTIERCITSVLCQNLSDFEIIVVDDASTDRTVPKLARITDPRMTVLVQLQNQGVSAARNRGIVAARSAIVCFLDSDDEYLPHKLATVYAYFSAHPSVGVLLDSFETHFPESMQRPPKQRLNPDLNDAESIRRAVYCREIYKATPALNVRRRTLLAAGLFDEQMRRREDMDMLIRLSHVAVCASTSAILWKKHWRPNSLSWPVDTFMGSLIDVAIRHREYVSHPAYRRGLGRDLTRHLLRLVRMRRLNLAVEDFRQFARRFGVATWLPVLVEGTRETWRRRRARARWRT